MKTRLILTVSGSDRPGLTSLLAEAIVSAGGNWLESHLSRLGGLYVGSVLVEVAAGAVGQLEAAVRAIDAEGLSVSSVVADEVPEGGGEPFAIDLVGADRVGIVSEVTRVLAGLGVNIEDLDTGIENGAWSGELLFRARVRARVPQGASTDSVRQALEAISGDLMVDFTFT